MEAYLCGRATAGASWSVSTRKGFCKASARRGTNPPAPSPGPRTQALIPISIPSLFLLTPHRRSLDTLLEATRGIRGEPTRTDQGARGRCTWRRTRLWHRTPPVPTPIPGDTPALSRGRRAATSRSQSQAARPGAPLRRSTWPGIHPPSGCNHTVLGHTRTPCRTALRGQAPRPRGTLGRCPGAPEARRRALRPRTRARYRAPPPASPPCPRVIIHSAVRDGGAARPTRPLYPARRTWRAWRTPPWCRSAPTPNPCPSRRRMRWIPAGRRRARRPLLFNMAIGPWTRA
mmetsp:Transcript_6131/g.11720  ORF Transcript_6131/g.11720 Transcript_6131/m.11720 type:complete len:288 (-) Transcript_6131:2071-2934(-)